VLFAGIMVFEKHPLGWLQDHWAELPRILAAGVILAVYYALVGLAVASLTGRRAFAIGGYLLVLVAPTVVSGLIGEAIGNPDWTLLPQLSVLPINFAASIFPDSDVPNSTGAWALAYLIVVGLAALVLLRRYGRRGET
jgi:ABC-2 type transport system permease protein